MSLILISVLNWIVAVQGIVATLFCLSLFVFFIRSKSSIGKAVGLDKLAEGFLAFMTLIFSFAVDGVWELGFNQITIALMRIFMFGVSILCSIHLSFATWRIIQSAHNSSSDNR